MPAIEMGVEEYEAQIKLLHAENKRLKNWICKLGVAITQYGESIGEDIQFKSTIKNRPDH